MSASPSRCTLCGTPVPEGKAFCSRSCAHAAKEAAKDGIETRIRRAFQRKRRGPGAAPTPEAEQMFLEVDGLWTAGAGRAAEEILKSLAGVFDAQIVSETGRGRAYYDPERISPRDLLKALRRYGFRATVVRDAWARAEAFSHMWEVSLAVRFGVSATLTLHVLYISALLHWERIRSATEGQTLSVLMFFLTLPVLAYGGWPIFSNAVWAVARRRVTADVLTALAALGAVGLSMPSLFERGMAHFDAACCAIVMTLFARLCEYRARRRLARAGEKLAGLVTGSAVRLRRGEEIPCSTADLRPGDVVIVNAGRRLPVDGDVIAGSGVLEPFLGSTTEISPGERVAAGARLVSGRLTIRAERTGAGTSLGEMARIVDGSITSRMPGTAAAARGLLFLGGAVAVFALTAFAGDTTGASLAAVLLAASPSAIALIPAIAGLSAMGRAAERAALYRGGDALASAGSADTAFLFRSALLEPRANASACAMNADPGEFWSVVASLVSVSPGPAAAALRDRARMEGAEPQVAVAPAAGPVARARIGGRDAAIGERTALEALGWEVPETLGRARREEEEGGSLIWVGWDGAVRGAVRVEAPDRRDAEETARRMARSGWSVAVAGVEAPAVLDAEARRLGGEIGLAESRVGAEADTRRAAGRQSVAMTRASAEAPDWAENVDLACAVDCAEEGAPDWAGLVSAGPDPADVEAALGSAKRAQAARRRAGVMAFLFHAAVLPFAASGLMSPLMAVGISSACGLYLIYVAFRAGGNPRG